MLVISTCCRVLRFTSLTPKQKLRLSPPLKDILLIPSLTKGVICQNSRMWWYQITPPIAKLSMYGRSTTSIKSKRVNVEKGGKTYNRSIVSAVGSQKLWPRSVNCAYRHSYEMIGYHKTHIRNHKGVSLSIVRITGKLRRMWMQCAQGTLWLCKITHSQFWRMVLSYHWSADQHAEATAS